MTVTIGTRRVHLGLTCLIAAAVILFPLLMTSASGQHESGHSGTLVQQYQIVDMTQQEFASLEAAQKFLSRIGQQGWIIPDQTQIVAHTFRPGTAAQYTSFLVHSGDFNEDGRFLILRREKR